MSSTPRHSCMSVRGAFLLIMGMLACMAPLRPACAATFTDPFTGSSISIAALPPVSGPVCVACNGRGCSDCRPSSGGTTRPDTGGTGGSGGGHTAPPRPAPPTNQPTAEERRQRDVYEREKQALLSLMKQPAAAPPVPLPADALLAQCLPTHLVQASGLSDIEWQRARLVQMAIDVLTQRWPVPGKDLAKLDALFAERNTLWAKAISALGLTAEDRERLRLKFHTAPLNPKIIAAVTRAQAALARKASAFGQGPMPVDAHPREAQAYDPVALALMQRFTVDMPTALIELKGEELADLMVEDGGSKFGTFLAVAKVGVAGLESTSDALAATGDVIIGTIPLPQAGLAIEGGRQYSNVAFRAMDNFLRKSMQATGGSGDTTAFWEKFNADLTTGQSAVRKFIGFGQ